MRFTDKTQYYKMYNKPTLLRCLINQTINTDVVHAIHLSIVEKS